MSKHPVLSKRLSNGLKGLFKRTPSRRNVRARSRKAHEPVDLKAAQTSSPKPASGNDKQETQLDDSGNSLENSSRKPRKPERKAEAKPELQVKSGKFWTDLFLVRPWLLVGGLWLTSVVMIAIALTGLSNPGRELVLEPVTSSVTGQPLSGPDAAAVSRLAPDGVAQRDPAATLPATAEQTMPAWPLLVMVAACAGGCLLMSRKGLLTSGDSRRGRRRKPQPTPQPLRVHTSAPAKSGRKRRKQRRLNPQRPASQVMAFRTGQKIHHTPPQKTTAVPKSVSFSLDHNAEPQVSIVPDNETSSLDWKEGSLAHKLDVRQTRSINSFL